jgi:hypothetical protein
MFGIRRTWVVFVTLALFAVNVSALGKTVHVKGYFKSNGTYVAPYVRTAPNSSRLDNWSTVGNVNPYTGKEGTVDPYSVPSTRSSWTTGASQPRQTGSWPAWPAPANFRAQAQPYQSSQKAYSTRDDFTQSRTNDAEVEALREEVARQRLEIEELRRQVQANSNQQSIEPRDQNVEQAPLQLAESRAPSAQEIQGAVYRYRGKDGETHYTNVRPPDGTPEMKLIFLYAEKPKGE